MQYVTVRVQLPTVTGAVEGPVHAGIFPPQPFGFGIPGVGPGRFPPHCAFMADGTSRRERRIPTKPAVKRLNIRVLTSMDVRVSEEIHRDVFIGVNNVNVKKIKQFRKPILAQGKLMQNRNAKLR